MASSVVRQSSHRSIKSCSFILWFSSICHFQPLFFHVWICSPFAWIECDSIPLDSNRFQCQFMHSFFCKLHKKRGGERVSDLPCRISIPIKVYSLFCASVWKTSKHTANKHAELPLCQCERRKAIVRFYFKTFHPYVIPSFKVYLVWVFSFSPLWWMW